MKVIYVVRRVNVVSANPSELLVSVFVSKPFNKVPEFGPAPPVDLRVNNLLDFEVLVTINDLNRSRIRNHQSLQQATRPHRLYRRIRLLLQDNEAAVRLDATYNPVRGESRRRQEGTPVGLDPGHHR